MLVNPGDKIYISGPMRGYEDFNFPAFNAAAAQLRSEGYEVINPAEKPGDAEMAWEECMRVDIQDIVNGAQAIMVLRGWEHSVGARIEILIGQTLGLPILWYDTRTQLEYEVHTEIANQFTSKESAEEYNKHALVS